MFDFNAQHIGHSSCVHKVDIRRAVLAVVIVFPVFHEDAHHFMALLFEQVSGHGRVHAARESDDNTLRGHGRHYPQAALEYIFTIRKT